MSGTAQGWLDISTQSIFMWLAWASLQHDGGTAVARLTWQLVSPKWAFEKAQVEAEKLSIT